MKINGQKKTGKGKIRNATKVVYDGIKFDSKLDMWMYEALKKNELPFTYSTQRFTIVDGFEYKGKKYLPITYKPDFVSDKFIIECKGFGNELFPMRWKLFKRYLMLNNLDYDLYICKNKKEINDLIYDIKRKEYDVQMSNMQ